MLKWLVMVRCWRYSHVSVQTFRVLGSWRIVQSVPLTSRQRSTRVPVHLPAWLTRLALVAVGAFEVPAAVRLVDVAAGATAVLATLLGGHAIPLASRAHVSRSDILGLASWHVKSFAAR